MIVTSAPKASTWETHVSAFEREYRMSRKEAEETTRIHTCMGYLICTDRPELSPPEDEEFDWDIF
ncbi:Uncharacterised protein [Corynebacterium renale]|nr:Uncharacterised protein [Corynebacterium renale]STC97278.1 Uncharacterised protein [Corynebacterium renale]